MCKYVCVATLDQVPPGKGRPVFVAGKSIALFNVNGEFFALDDSCPHAGSSLGMGKLDGTTVQCRAHGLRFDVRTGFMRGAGGLRATSYPVMVAGSEVMVRLDNGAHQRTGSDERNPVEPCGGNCAVPPCTAS
jgi:3-phenylpropionate/trans-cinnamate dioxygenase ferredoxin subunit